MTESSEEKPDKESLIAEYQVLNDTVNRRYRDSLLVESIMIPASLGIVTFAIVTRKDLGTSVFIDLPISIFIPLVSFILVFLLYLRRLTTIKITDISFERMREIETILHIKGHRYIRERTRCKTWFKVRWLIYHFIFLLIMGAYLLTAYWLYHG